MNKILKYSLIGLGVVAAGTTLYFVFRKPKDGSTDETKGTDEKVEEKKEETTPSDTTSTSSTESKTSSTETTKSTTTPDTKKPDAKKPVVNTDKLKGYNVQLILSKSKNPNVIKGKFISAEKNGTRLLDKNGKLMFTLKKDDIVGNLLGAKLTAKGDYMAYVKMRDGKVTQTLASNLKFA